MRQPIYLDILFLLNMLVTFLLLSAASHLAAVRTVSYTHLDVYKRQVQSGADRNIRLSA